MSMFGIIPLTGAYGRDYKSKAAIVKDWLAGKDFRTAGNIVLSEIFRRMNQSLYAMRD